MNNMSSYCGLVDAKIRVSGKDLPVLRSQGRYKQSERDFNPLCTSCATMILSKLIVIKKGERRADFLSLMPKAAVFREWKLCDADSQYIPIII